MRGISTNARRGLCVIAVSAVICPFLFLGLGRDGGHSSSSFLSGHNNNNSNERRLQTATPGGVLLAGLVEDAENISPSTIDFLVELSCQAQVAAHIFVSKGVEDLRHSYKERSARMGVAGGKQSCADFFVEQDETDLDRAYPNRIDRMSHIRDSQRELLESFYEARSVDTASKPFEYVIVVDLDLHRTPTSGNVLRAIQYLHEESLDGSSSVDAMCANGLTLDGKLPYDSYATVLLPDTFLGYFLRSDPNLMPNEDSTAIDAYIEATTSTTPPSSRWGEWAKALASDFFGGDDGLIPVKSCFGGLAIYRTDAWFANECKYTSDYTSDHVKYIAAGTGRVCEHVVFNHCLRTKYKADFSMAVHRGLVTKYHEANDPNVAVDTTATGRDLKSRVHKVFFSATNANEDAKRHGIDGVYGKRYGQTEKGIHQAISKGNPYAKKYGLFERSPRGRERVHGPRNLKSRIHGIFFSGAIDPSAKGERVGQSEKGTNHAITQGNPYAKKYGLYGPSPPGRQRTHGH